jgi:ribosome modulation factor
MKTLKRDKVERAFSLGYKAGVRKRSIDLCPYISVTELRGSWMGGWREGRHDANAGYLHAGDV